MSREHDTTERKPPVLSKCLIDIRNQCMLVRNDMESMIGLMDNIHSAENVYELQHRLRTLLGREKSTTRMMRRLVALLEPLETVLEHLKV